MEFTPMKTYKILTINPGSTSTKIALFHNHDLRFLQNIRHDIRELNEYNHIHEQYPFRLELIIHELEKAHINIQDIDGIVARGGLLKPISSGVYFINDAMIQDLKTGVQGHHASNLGGLIAFELQKKLKEQDHRAFIADPVVVDELDELARISGHPKFQRISIFHALNQKAIARTHARAIGKKYEDLNLIIAHLGGGISVGAHQKGRVIDVNQALDGDGPFSPERSGSLPAGDLIRLCFSGDYTLDQVQSMVTGQGGLVAYLGTNNAAEMDERAENGDKNALLIEKALTYQIAKEIGAMSTVLKGEVDAILLTGGMAFINNLIELIKKRVMHIASVGVYPGEDEMKALAYNGYMVLSGQWQAKTYS